VRDDVADAWAAVGDALARLPGWEASRPVYHREERCWTVTAFRTGHVLVGQRRSVMESHGMTEAGALRELEEALRRRSAPRR
jgi:hypothetical protein